MNKIGRFRVPRPRRIPPPKPQKTFGEKVKKGLQKTGEAVATGVAGYGVAEGIGAVMNGAPQNNNNNPIVIQMPAPETATTTALKTIPANVSGEMSDLKVLVLALMVIVCCGNIGGPFSFLDKIQRKASNRKVQGRARKAQIRY